jgi:thiosulfate reductase cytochrome b subunit
MSRVERYTLFERLWHWLQAGLILSLLVTGIEIHSPGTLPIFGFARAARLHEALALLTVANAFLSLFYHLATGAIGQFIPPAPKDFFGLAIEQVAYYAKGIFQGAAHPLAHASKLTVLQQVTYLAILNLLLPVQIVTGVLIWKAPSWPKLIAASGGLGVIAGIHTLCAWLFAAFVVVHVYLTTTGRTPLSHIKAMLTGYEDEHPKQSAVEMKDSHEQT